MNRRAILKHSLAAAAGFGAAAPAVRRTARAQAPPSERVRAGFVGVAGRAGGLLAGFAAQRDVEVVAVAEIDPRRVPGAMRALEEQGVKPPAVHTDFRRLVDDPSIDVLVVGTPDHWHAIPTLMACAAGKDVYVEKPDGHNMLEGQRMVAAMRKHGRVVQLGTQSRSYPRLREAMDHIRSGALGRVLVAKAWETAKQGPVGSPPDGDPPPEVDYSFWLGPAPERPFNPLRFHGTWRWFFDYGTGDLGNDGVHRIDIARWALATAAEAEGQTLPALPRKVSALGGKWYFDDAQEWPDTLQASYEFDGTGGRPGRLLTYEMRIWSPNPTFGAEEGAAVFGDQGYLVISNSGWRTFDPDDQVVAEGKEGGGDGDHIRNFLDCVKSRRRPNADLETVGHPSSVFCHAGNVAWRVGRQLELVPETERFVGDPEANAMRARPEYREPWSLPDV